MSNTAKIIESFKTGFEKGGNTTEAHYLSQKNKWGNIRDAFNGNEHILFAIPLFFECVPGIMLEFLETLEPKEYPDGMAKTKIGFILQGGLAEASQLRCGEQYLERLPGYLNCQYSGTLIKGNMSMVSMLGDKSGEKLVAPFMDMGEYYAEHGAFSKERVSDFAKPEYFSKGFILLYKLLNPMQRLFISLLTKKRGRTDSLKAKPYQKYLV
jgi:hypothetical protein